MDIALRDDAGSSAVERSTDLSADYTRAQSEGLGELIGVSAWHERLRRFMPASASTVPPLAPLTRFYDIDGRIKQPALDCTVLAIHLGGPKRVVRRQGKRTLDADVAVNSLTLMPQGEPFEWETFGSIDFAHLILQGAEIEEVVSEEFDRDLTRFWLEPLVGVESRPVADALNGLVACASDINADNLFRDCAALLLSVNVVEIFGRHPSCGATRRRTGTLATWQLRRVVDYMRDHMAENIDLAALVALTGLGRAQFFRSFKRSMGRSPLVHLRHLRLLEARRLLVDAKLPITTIAGLVGLDPTRLLAAFRATYNMTPSMFRAVARS